MSNQQWVMNKRALESVKEQISFIVSIVILTYSQRTLLHTLNEQH